MQNTVEFTLRPLSIAALLQAGDGTHGNPFSSFTTNGTLVFPAGFMDLHYS